MNRNKYLKPFFLFPLMVAIGLLVTACSSDDDSASSSTNFCYEGEIKGGDNFGNTYIITNSVPSDSPSNEIGEGVFISVKSSWISEHGFSKGDIINFQILSYSIANGIHDGYHFDARYICEIKLCE